MKLAFLFRTAPHGNAISREGLDALLAATAFCDEEEIGVFFIDDGVLNLLDGQNLELLLQKDFIRTFKLLDLYDIEQRFVCADSLDQYNLQTEQLMISAEKIDRTSLINKLSQAEKVFTFQRYLTEITENDAVVLWQDGVLLAVKYGEMFTQCKGQCFVLEQDILARNLTALLPENNQVRLISLADLVDLTAQYSPQIAL